MRSRPTEADGLFAFTAPRIAAVALFAAASVQAQTLDSLSLEAQGRDVVARLSFNATVRFLRQSPVSATQLYRIDFELVGAEETLINQATPERLSAKGLGLAPDIDVSYAAPPRARTRQLTVQLARTAALKVRQGPTGRSLEFVFTGAALEGVPAAPAAAASAPEPPAAPAAEAPAEAPAGTASPAEPAAPALSEVDRRANDLLAKARDALVARRHDEAADLLNRLLLLPPNVASQEAQELIGLAFERAGNAGRARAEYQLYLKLFPEGEGADRVRQRLAAMDGGTPTPVAAAASGAAGTTPAPATPPKTFGGSVAQYYYGGVARSQSLVNLAAGIDQQTLTRTTQSAIVTSADLNARYANPESETRVVVRGTGSSNLSSESKNRSLLSTAYVDYRRVESGLAVRAGRQSAISGGLLGLFDGVSAVYPVRQGLKVDLMGGVPANTLVSAPSQRLLAAMVEADGLFEQWGGNAYLLDQTSEGFTNRRAAGLELRFSSEAGSGYALFDYDINFRLLNAVSLQGSVQLPAQTTVTVLVDARRAPSLQLTNALIPNGFGSLTQLFAQPGYSMAQARTDAVAVSAIAKQALLSVSRPINEKWQAGVDLRVSQVGALPAIGDYQATPATGTQIGVGGQLTGSNLYSSRDINNFSFSATRTPLYKGVQIAYNNLTGLRGDDLTVEPSIRVYGQTSSDGLKLLRFTPGLRLSYRLSRRASVLGESIVERSTTDGPTGHDSTNSIFFYLGYRYDFN